VARNSRSSGQARPPCRVRAPSHSPGLPRVPVSPVSRESAVPEESCLTFTFPSPFRACLCSSSPSSNRSQSGFHSESIMTHACRPGETGTCGMCSVANPGLPGRRGGTAGAVRGRGGAEIPGLRPGQRKFSVETRAVKGLSRARWPATWRPLDKWPAIWPTRCPPPSKGSPSNARTPQKVKKRRPGTAPPARAAPDSAF
jgi:hypothetical protein